MKITQSILLFFVLAAGLVPTQAGAEAQKGTSMGKLTVLLDGHPVVLTPPPLRKDDGWLVPLESFCQVIGAKVEYPGESGMAVVCQADRCVPLKIGDIEAGAIEIDGGVYASPAVVVEPFGFQIQAQSSDRIEIVTGGVQMKDTGKTAGRLAHDFTLTALDGAARRLSDFRGKKTLLYIWGSW